VGYEAVFLLEFSCVNYDPMVELSMSVGSPVSEVYGEEEALFHKRRLSLSCVVGCCCRFRL
jgi:hypothetical protein